MAMQIFCEARAGDLFTMQKSQQQINATSLNVWCRKLLIVFLRFLIFVNVFFDTVIWIK